MFPLEIWNVCDEILNDEPTINNQTKRWFRILQLTNLEYRLQGSPFNEKSAFSPATVVFEK